MTNQEIQAIIDSESIVVNFEETEVTPEVDAEMFLDDAVAYVIQHPVCKDHFFINRVERVRGLFGDNEYEGGNDEFYISHAVC